MPSGFDSAWSDDAASPASLLDLLRDHPEWGERDRAQVFERLITKFPPETLLAAIRPRFGKLDGADGEAILQIAEAFGTEEFLAELASALEQQPNLAPERAWLLLTLLDGSGVLHDFPELAERFEELSETFDEAEMSLTELAERLEEDPEEIWIALHGLTAVEAEVRSEIVAGLGDIALGPGGLELLRLLIFAHDVQLRSTALAALERQPGGTDLQAVWERIVAEHSDTAIIDRARAHLPAGATALVARQNHDEGLPAAPVTASVITSLDSQGQGYIVFGSATEDGWSVAAFLCDVLHGVRDVVGHTGIDAHTARAFLNEFATLTDRDAVEDAHATALALFSGSAALCGPSTPPTIRYWVERTVGPSMLRASLPRLLPELDTTDEDASEAVVQARAVLEACNGWVDDSDLTYELAEELLLREGGAEPDPVRDSGAFRFLFENRLNSRLELDRRMLLWMASFWQASEDPDLARSALVLARELADAERVGPAQPFPQALAARSLAAAQENLQRGIDLRDPATRARIAPHAPG